MNFLKRLFRPAPPRPREILSGLNPEEELIVIVALGILTKDFKRLCDPWETLRKEFLRTDLWGNEELYRISIERLE